MNRNNASTWLAGGVLSLSLALGGALLLTADAGNPSCPDGKCKLKPAPRPTPMQPKRPRPQPRPCPGTDARCLAVGEVSAKDGKSSWVNGREADGEVLTADFPGTLYMKNIGSYKDGAGMCVMTSITMCAKYLGLADYYDLRDWCANEPGGGYRTKVDNQIRRYEKAKGIAAPVAYLQYEGPDPGPVLEAIDRARLPLAHTYGWSPRYNSRIAHMVAGVKHSGRLAVVLDNNPMTDFDIGSNKIFEWMSRAEMIRRAKLGQGGNLWLFAWLAPPPPPCPKVE